MLETKYRQETREEIDNNDHYDIVLDNNICFTRHNRFSVLHRSVLYDKQLEEIRKAFYDKYSIDYLAMWWMEIDKLDNHNNYYMENINHDKWRDLIISKNLDRYDPTVIAVSELKPGEEKLIFPDISNAKTFNLRGELVGEYKNSFEIIMHSNISNLKWGYSITLKGLASILSISYETYVQLRRDLQKIEPFLIPFYDYFKEFGSITDTPELKHKLKDHNFNFVI